jgi:hypothetical protein
MKKVERRIVLDEDAAVLLLQLAGGPRKQGAYLSALIRRAAGEQTVEARIRALEQDLARLKAAIGASSTDKEQVDG